MTSITAEPESGDAPALAPPCPTSDGPMDKRGLVPAAIAFITEAERRAALVRSVGDEMADESHGEPLQRWSARLLTAIAPLGAALATGDRAAISTALPNPGRLPNCSHLT